jgi:hypothetical protein
MFTSKQIRRCTMRQPAPEERSHNEPPSLCRRHLGIGLGACADRNEKVTQQAGTPAVTAAADPAARLVLAERRIVSPSVSAPE